MTVSKAQSERIRKLGHVLAADVEGVENEEGRSQLDFLITTIQSASPTVLESWQQALLEVVSSVKVPPRGWWHSLERLVVLSKLESFKLGELLELALSENKCPFSSDRASVYALLDSCGKPPLSSTLMADEALKSEEPLLWLDLILLRVPTLEDSQRLVLEAAHRGIFSLPQFIQRLDEMRSIGGSHLGFWLRTFREALSAVDRPEFDEVAAEAFGPWLKHASPVIDAADRGDTMQRLGEPQKPPPQLGTTIPSDDLSGHVIRNLGGTQMNSSTDTNVITVPEFVQHNGKQRPFKRAICLGGGGPAAGLHIGVLEGLAANRIKFTRESDIWALSCIGAWVGILYNQAKKDHEIEETYNFFRGIFRDNKSFQSFPMNTVFAPDYAANAEAMLDYLLEPRHYKNVFLPREIMKSFMHTMSALRGMATSRRMPFGEGDFNRWVLNDVLAVNPAVRLWMGMVYKSEITGLARLYYPDSKFLRDIKFDQLEHHHKPYLFHNAWNLRWQDIQLFSNRDPGPPSHDRYKRITPQSLCACSALPFVEETVEIDGEPYCEGALKDTVNFKDLLKDHHHPPHDPLDEIWISRIVDADQVRAPRDLHDALANLCQLFAATVGEDDVKLFLCKVRAHENDRDPAKAYKGTIVGIPTSSHITYEWSHRNLEAGRHYGRIAAQKAVNEYEACGGPQPYGHLRIIGDKLREDERDEIKKRRREAYLHP